MNDKSIEDINKLEKYLPLGSVVMLENGVKKVMITGFCCYGTIDKDKVYDYAGCMYPEGMASSEQTLLFDHSQIKKVYHLGLNDEIAQAFYSKLKEQNI